MNRSNEERFQPQLSVDVNVQFNETTAICPKEKLIHQLFEEQVKGTPDEVAVEHEGRRLTYVQLNSRANQLARYLSSEGVGPGEVVGICIECGLDMAVALLAIVKAGGTYLPLDPNCPREILQQILRAAVPAIVLAETELIGVLPTSQARLIALDERLGQVAGLIAEDLQPECLGLTSESPVCVNYTSGSAGRLNGTAVRHGSVVELIEWHRRAFGNGRGRRVLQFAAQSSDVALQEIFSALCLGGTLVLLDEWVRRDANALTELLIERSIERLFVSPLMLQSIAERCRRTNQLPRSLKDVISGGEPLRVTAEMRELFGRLEGCRLYNQHGSENARAVLVLTVEENHATRPEVEASGRENPSTRMDLLDDQKKQTPTQAPPRPLSVELVRGGV